PFALARFMWSCRGSAYRWKKAFAQSGAGRARTERTTMKEDTRSHPLRDSHQDARAAEAVPDTPQTRAPAYRLSFLDTDFLMREELRPVRLQLELLKPQMVLDERGVKSTVVLMGSARIPEP